MIPLKADISIEQSNNFVESDFKIAGSAPIFKILRDSLYADKITSVMREFICNATDSHIASNKRDTKVLIVLPSVLEPSFRVRDYGSGLNDEDIRNVFCSYGATTKNTSNEYIGMMGIGSKSWAAYANSCTITSIHEGKKRIYNLYIDESEVGKVALLAEESVDELSGIEVCIPVKQADIVAFRVKLKDLMRFNDSPVNIHGGYDSFVNDWIIKEPTWGMLKNSDAGSTYYHINKRSFVVMGGVPYKIDNAGVQAISSLHATLLTSGIVIFCNIGDIQVAASRENVSYTPKTISYITNVMKNIEVDAMKTVDKAFADAKTVYEGRKLYYDFFSTNGRMGSILTSIFKSEYRAIVNIGGTPVSISDWRFQMASCLCYDYAKGRRWNSIFKLKTTASCHTDLFSSSEIFVDISDLSESVVKNRVRYWLTKNKPVNTNQSVQVLVFDDKPAYDAWTNSNGIDNSKFIDITSVIIPKAPRKARVSKSIDTNNSRLLISAPNSGWQSFDADLSKGGCYVIRSYDDYYLKSDSEETQYHAIRDSQTHIRNYNNTIINIYAFTESVIKKLDKNLWKPYYDVARPYIMKWSAEDSKRKPEFSKYTSHGIGTGFAAVLIEMHQRGLPLDKDIQNLFKITSPVDIKIKAQYTEAFDVKTDSSAFEAARAKINALILRIHDKYPYSGIINSASMACCIQYIEAMNLWHKKNKKVEKIQEKELTKV